jgi:hypothetical protein
MNHDEILTTGKYRFRSKRLHTLPHGWDASFLFEETTGTLLCSDLLGHNGDTAPLTESDVVGRFRGHDDLQCRPVRSRITCRIRRETEAQIRELAALKPRVCATMHGSTFDGNGEQALLDMAATMKELLG